MKKKSLVAMLVVVCSIILMLGISVQAQTLHMEVGEKKVVTAAAPRASYLVRQEIARNYVWSIDSGGSVISITYDNKNTCTITAKKAGKARFGCKAGIRYKWGDSPYPNNWYEGYEETPSIWDVVVYCDPTGVSLPESVSVDAEESKTIEATVKPSGATSSLTWKSSDTSVATVSGGKITGVNPGTATITVKTSNGYSDTCKVTVTKPELYPVKVSPIDYTYAEKDTKIEFTYNSNISKGAEYDNIALYDKTANRTVEITKSISGKTITITPANDLESGHSYRAAVPDNAVVNKFGVGNSASVARVSELINGTTQKITNKTSFTVEFNDVEPAVVNNVTLKIDARRTVATKDGGYVSVEDNKLELHKSGIDENPVVVYSEGRDDNFWGVAVADGGYIAVGYSDGEALAVKFDNEGDLLWRKTYDDFFSLSSIIAVEDGYIGSATVKALGRDKIVKLNEKGNIEWESKVLSWYGKSQYHCYFIKDIAETKDGYVAVGYANSYENVYGKTKRISSTVIAKYDKKGNILWEKYSYDNDEEWIGKEFYDVEITASGKIVAVGEMVNYVLVDDSEWYYLRDALITKFDENGNIIWEKIFSNKKDEALLSGKDDCFNSVIVDGGRYIVLGDSDGENLLLEYDGEGNIHWKKPTYIEGKNLMKLSSGRYAVSSENKIVEFRKH